MSGAVDFVEDPYIHIVSITINIAADAAFVVKTLTADIFYGRPKGSPEQSQDWPQWAEPYDVFGGFFANSGASSALVGTPGKPVWVLSARRSKDGSNGGIILYSEDGGATWEVVFEQYEDEGGPDLVPLVFEPTGIVWDEDQKAFFASFFVTDVHNFTEIDELQLYGEEIHRSADGRTWTLVSRNMEVPLDGDPATMTSDIFAYCKKPENQNRSGGDQKIPDGLQGYNPTTETFIRPTGLLGFDPYDGARYDEALTPSVTRIDALGRTRVVPVDVVDCYAVAYFAGVWVAAGGDGPIPGISPPGGLYIAVSFDDGLTWANVFQQVDIRTTHAATVIGQRVAVPA